MNQQVISMVVTNNVGVLARVNSIFSRKMLNIMSLTISYEGDPQRPRMTMLVDGQLKDADLACKILSKNEDVHFIDHYTTDETIQREMVLVKLPNDEEIKKSLEEIAVNFKFDIIREKDDEIIIEYTGSVLEADFFLEKIKSLEKSQASRASVILIDNIN